ncbi:hypothetical protein [Lichenicola sp.]|uniref:hypothetical protein n=1 Tax=Lichenicola sp. TaxID=2804529 RepID=UPI003B0075C1
MPNRPEKKHALNDETDWRTATPLHHADLDNAIRKLPIDSGGSCFPCGGDIGDVIE